MTDEAEDNPLRLIGFDIVKAVAIAQDDVALELAYRKVFGSVEGKAVLLDLMADCQMLGARRPDMSALERAHRDGEVTRIAKLMDRAGVSNIERVAGLQAATKIDSMERAHDRTEPNRDGRPGTGGGTTDDGTEGQFE